jgi:hypothetical protein
MREQCVDFTKLSFQVNRSRSATVILKDDMQAGAELL